MQNLAQQQQNTLFDELRAGFDFVATHAKHVQIDYQKLDDYAAMLLAQSKADIYSEENHYLAQDAEHVYGFAILMSAINFGGPLAKILEEEGSLPQGAGIYVPISSRLKAAFEHAPITPARAATISIDEVEHVFGFVKAEISQIMAVRFTAALNEIGAFIHETYGTYTAFVKAVKSSVETGVKTLLSLPNFQDEAVYSGRKIGIYKRAQIMMADLQMAHHHMTGEGLFNDIHLLTHFPDNAVPAVFLHDGILSISADLQTKIDAGNFLDACGAEEVELRCCAAHVIELLAGIMGKIAMDVDHLLWHRSELIPDLVTHKTDTIFY